MAVSFLSDHFGLMVYADVADAYASRAKADVTAVLSRRKEVVTMRDECHRKEVEEVKAMLQAGRDNVVNARLRVAERDKKEFQRLQRRAAQQRQQRRAGLRQAAFGVSGMFSEEVESVPALGAVVPCAPTDVGIPALDGLGPGSWETVREVPLRGLTNVGNTCFVNSVARRLCFSKLTKRWILPSTTLFVLILPSPLSVIRAGPSSSF